MESIIITWDVDLELYYINHAEHDFSLIDNLLFHHAGTQDQTKSLTHYLFFVNLEVVLR